MGRRLGNDGEIMEAENIFATIPVQLPEELTEALACSPHVKIRRIISRGHRSPADCWYDQEQNEWVLLLKGGAGLAFENVPDITELKPGDYINIPAHVRHRVAWTADDEDTVWLAIHY